MASRSLARIFSLATILCLGLAPALAWAQVTTFSTQDNPRADGLAFTIDYPADYELVDSPKVPNQLFVAYSEKPEFPTVLTVLVDPLPQTQPPYDYKLFTQGNLDEFVAAAFTAPGQTPRILYKSIGQFKSHSSIRAKALVNQTFKDQNQPSIEEILFVIYNNHNITIVCSTFNSQHNPNILLHFAEQGSYEACGAFFNSLVLP
ncbi:MAG: hypothetical protein LBJ61_06145 [Deltaproteobacteria bacterium]|nr:hypothetical protein [Deltaproteobacteria bacterium]